MSITNADLRPTGGVTNVNRAIASAAVIVFVLATADLIFACTYWHQLYGVPWSRLLQNIASGLLGKRSFAAGAPTVLLGVLLQYIMMSMMVGAYYAMSTRIRALCERPWRYGLLYGALLYVVMNDVVVPLSAAPKGPAVPSWIISSIFAHLVIGVSIALGARRAARST